MNDGTIRAATESVHKTWKQAEADYERQLQGTTDVLSCHECQLPVERVDVTYRWLEGVAKPFHPACLYEREHIEPLRWTGEALDRLAKDTGEAVLQSAEFRFAGWNTPVVSGTPVEQEDALAKDYAFAEAQENHDLDTPLRARGQPRCIRCDRAKGEENDLCDACEERELALMHIGALHAVAARLEDNDEPTLAQEVRHAALWLLNFVERG